MNTYVFLSCHGLNHIFLGRMTKLVDKVTIFLYTEILFQLFFVFISRTQSAVNLFFYSYHAAITSYK